MSRPQFQEYMHAFASLVSMEKVNCELKEKECSIGPELGWNPSAYFKIHKQLLNTILSQVPAEAKNADLRSFVKRQLTVIDDLILFENNSSVYLNYIKIFRDIKDPGTFILYPWNTADHQIYLDIWHRSNGEVWLNFFDLGGGRTGESPVRGNYSPITRKFASLDEARQFLDTIVLPKQGREILNKDIFKITFDLATPPSAFVNQDAYQAAFEQAYKSAYIPEAIKFYSPVYGNPGIRDLCISCMPEALQTTGNCVVKNLLAAIKQDALWVYGNGPGATIFKEFYLLLLQAVLSQANAHAGPFLTKPLPDLAQQVCPAIQGSQLTFVGTSCVEIYGRIANLYEGLNTKVVIPRPIPSNPSITGSRRYRFSLSPTATDGSSSSASGFTPSPFRRY